jgi:hypothetical protein
MALINTTTTGVLGSTFFGDGTGSLTVQQNGVTLGVFGNQPAFFVRPSAGQTVTFGTYTKIQLNTEDFDTNSNYDTSTYRFTPTIAGYYQISAALRGTGSSSNTSTAVVIYKNGSAYLGQYSVATATTQYPTISALVYMNGSSDYIEFYGKIEGTGTASFGTVTSQGDYVTWASGVLVRAA